MSHRSRDRFDFGSGLALLGALVGWSVGPIFIKYLTTDFDAWSQNFYRYLAASLVWLPWLLVTERRGTLDPTVWKRARTPALCNVVMQCAWAQAYYYVDPGFMAILMKTSVIWIIVFSMIFLPEERRLLHRWPIRVGCTLAGAGVLGVLLQGNTLRIPTSHAGIGLILIASIAWALYVVSARMAFRHTDSRLGFAVTSLYTLLGLGLVYVPLAQPLNTLPRTFWPWVCVVLSGVTAIAIAHVCYYAAMRRIGPTIPAVAVLSTPFVILTLSHIVFGETLTPAQCGWGMVLLAGAGVATWAQRDLDAPPQEKALSPH